MIIEARYRQKFNACDAAQDFNGREYVALPNEPNNVYDYVGFFFYQARRLLSEYPNVIKSIELVIGDVMATSLDLKQRKEERQHLCLPTSFHRITLSNIPDYAGLLMAIVCTCPLLASIDLTYLVSFILLLNTVFWSIF